MLSDRRHPQRALAPAHRERRRLGRRLRWIIRVPVLDHRLLSVPWTWILGGIVLRYRRRYPGCGVIVAEILRLGATGSVALVSTERFRLMRGKDQYFQRPGRELIPQAPIKAPQLRTRKCTRRNATRPFRGAPMKRPSCERRVNEAFKRDRACRGGYGLEKLLSNISRVWGTR
jgi:hypothetical protein